MLPWQRRRGGISAQATAALLIGLMVGSCNLLGPDLPPEFETRPGMLSLIGSEPRVTVPETARVGEPLVVTVTTHAAMVDGICVGRRHETRVQVRGMVVEIRPIDGGRRPPPDGPCIALPVDIHHEAELRPSAAGTLTVRIIGLSRPRVGVTETLTVERRVTVEP